MEYSCLVHGPPMVAVLGPLLVALVGLVGLVCLVFVSHMAWYIYLGVWPLSGPASLHIMSPFAPGSERRPVSTLGLVYLYCHHHRVVP